MEITEVKVRLWNDQRLRALVTVVFEGCFVVRNIKVIEGRDKKLFVAMPSRRMPDGRYGDIAHPITREFRHQMESVILGAYLEECEHASQQPTTGADSRGSRRSRRADSRSEQPADDLDDLDREDEDSPREGWYTT